MKNVKQDKPPKAYSPRFQALGWDYYSRGNRPPSSYTTEELQKIVRKASKAANQRIRTIERSGMKSAALYLMQRQTGKKRFSERVKSKSRQELVKQFVYLREFVGAQTSTITGIKAHRTAIINTYMARGFNGTEEELEFLLNKYIGSQMSKFYGSTIVYQMIIENDRASLEDYYKTWIEEQRKEAAGEETDDRAQGRALIRMIKRKAKK